MFRITRYNYFYEIEAIVRYVHEKLRMKFWEFRTASEREYKKWQVIFLLIAYWRASEPIISTKVITGGIMCHSVHHNRMRPSFFFFQINCIYCKKKNCVILQDLTKRYNKYNSQLEVREPIYVSDPFSRGKLTRSTFNPWNSFTACVQHPHTNVPHHLNRALSNFISVTTLIPWHLSHPLV